MINEQSTVLVTGGTGSFGKKFVSQVLSEFPKIRKLVIYSRDELKQYEMAQLYPKEQYPGIRFLLGDVRDEQRLRRAFESIDTVVHAAALKHVPASEYNPFEFIRTNVLGAQHIVNAALDCGVKSVVALSTDKAAAPANLYGASKLCADKLFVAANNMRGTRDTKFIIVRCGNLMGSRGSVIPLFLQQRHNGELTIAHPDMTRFNNTMSEAVKLVLMALKDSLGGEIFIPKIPTFSVSDLAKAIAPDAKMKIVGIRPGDKLHEEMITRADAPNTVDVGDYYLILPTMSDGEFVAYQRHYNFTTVGEDFQYDSEEMTKRLSIREIRELIREHVEPGFSVDAE